MTRWQKFKRFSKRYFFALCAVLAGAGFIQMLADIKEIIRKARMPNDKMMLGHHPQCNVRISMIGNVKYKCDCYMSYIHQERKELDKFREQAKKKDRGIW